MHFPTRLSGAEDGMDCSHSDLISLGGGGGGVWCSSPGMEFWFSIYFFFLVISSASQTSHDFLAQICFHLHFFSLHLCLLTFENV